MRDVPDEFDVYSVVILRRADDAPEMTEEALGRLQAEHLAYRAGLARRGVLVANGPFLEQDDDAYRGMSIFDCDGVEAARLSQQDPSVLAGRLTYEVMQWWVAAGTFGFPHREAHVGRRRRLEDMA